MPSLLSRHLYLHWQLEGPVAKAGAGIHLVFIQLAFIFLVFILASLGEKNGSLQDVRASLLFLCCSSVLLTTKE